MPSAMVSTSKPWASRGVRFQHTLGHLTRLLIDGHESVIAVVGRLSVDATQEFRIIEEK